MRTPVVAGNWKMNNTLAQATALAEGIAEATAGLNIVELVVGPTALCLKTVSDSVKGSKIGVSAQNMYWAEKGAYTGELGPTMLLDVGCTYAILGHSERREYFGEDDELIHRKVRAALAHGLTPILCFGETLGEREAGRTQEKVDFQIRAALSGISADDIPSIILAYEPIWAIGTGRTASPEQAQEVHGAIRALLTELYGGAIAAQTRVLYGGSVKPGNIADIIGQPDIDGALVGGASLDAEHFALICAQANENA